MAFLNFRPRAGAASASVLPAVLIGAFVSLGGILFGYDTGTIAGIQAMPYWVKVMATETDSTGASVMTSSQTSLIVSILSAGTFFGALCAGPIGDWLGRRWGLIFLCGVFSVGAALRTAATAIPLFVVGRLIAGLGVGLVSALVPLYQSETAPKRIRGTVVGMYQLCINIGLIFSAVVENSTGSHQDTGSYRIPCAVQILFAILLSGGMLFLPETPRYLIKNGQTDKATRAMGVFRGLDKDHPEVMAEIQEILDGLEFEHQKGARSYIDCFRGHIRKRQLTGCTLQAFQQLSGINFIFYYGTKFFQTSGIGKPFIITMIVNVVATISTIPGLYLVEKMGRRNLLLTGALGMAVCQLIVAIVGVSTGSLVANKVLIAFVCFYIFFFEFSWGPCAWAVTGEIFPLETRSKSLSMTTASNWLFNFVLAFVTPYMVDSGAGNADLGVKVFFVWTAFCILAAIFVWSCIYETKGLPLEQVNRLYLDVTYAWHSPAHNKAMRLGQRIENTGSSEVRIDEVKHA